MNSKLPLAVLVSGSGSNLSAILARAEDPDYGAEVVVVLADRSGVRALDRAAEAGVPTEVVEWSQYSSRAEFTSGVCDAVERHGAEVMVMAGFMRILSPEAVRRFPNRILNTHPALSPAFPGAHAIQDALDYGVKVSGVTVHFVDEDVDHGPIIAQVAVPVHDDDDEAALQSRIQRVEHELYPDVIHAFARGNIKLGGRKVVWS